MEKFKTFADSFVEVTLPITENALEVLTVLSDSALQDYHRYMNDPKYKNVTVMLKITFDFDSMETFFSIFISADITGEDVLGEESGENNLPLAPLIADTFKDKALEYIGRKMEFMKLCKYNTYQA